MLLILVKFSHSLILNARCVLTLLDISAQLISLCIVSLPVITCQLQAPSPLTYGDPWEFIAVWRSTYLHRLPFVAFSCAHSPRDHRTRDVKSSGRESIIAFTQKSRRLIRRVLAYVLATRGKSLMVCGKRR